MLYFDHNATSPACEEARQSWIEGVARFPGNPSSPHRWGSRASRALDEARERVAAVIGGAPEDVVWTSGATEGNNMVLHHAAAMGWDEIWISAVEHPCVLAAARRWFPGKHRLIPVDARGVVPLAWLTERWNEGARPRLVGLMAANNELGVLQPWAEVADWCREREIPYFCDAAQWLGKLPGKGLGDAAFVTGCAHKFGGTPGVGFLKCPAGLRALLVGGAQEEGRRAGTENVPGALACAAALEAREKAIAELEPRVRAAWRDRFEAEMGRAIQGLEILGEAGPRLWNTSALRLPPVDCRRRWVVRLDKLGCLVSTGSACSSGQEKPSHVLSALGLDGSGERLLRVSAGWETAAADWDVLAETLSGVAAEWGVGRTPG